MILSFLKVINLIVQLVKHAIIVLSYRQSKTLTYKKQKIKESIYFKQARSDKQSTL